MKLDVTGKILLGIAIMLGVYILFFPPLELQLRSEEPRRALISMEMIFTGDYIKPQIHGWLYYNKPPLFNWIVVVFMKIFQSFDEWVIRLPGLVSHAFIAVLIFITTKKTLTKTGALLASLFNFTSSEILFYGAVIAGQIDLFYSLLVFLQLIFLFTALRERRLDSLLGSYFFMCLGILTKGAPSIAFQLLTIVSWMMIHRKEKWSSTMVAHWWGGLLALGISGFYFILYQKQGGNAVIYLINLFNEASQKSGLETNGQDLLKNLMIFPGTFLKLVLPWILLALFLLRKNIRFAAWEHPLVRFSIVVIGANVALYWVSGYVTTRYLFPFVPFISIILAYLAIRSNEDIKIEYFFRIIQIIGFVAVLALTWFLITSTNIMVEYRLSKIIFSWLGMTSILLAFWWIPHQRMLLSVVLVLLLKWYSQWTFYPDRYVDERINSLIAQIPPLFSHTKGDPIHLLGHPEKHLIDVSFGRWTLVDTTFFDPMPLSYQLPYYIERQQGRIMEFHTTMRKDTYYLVRKQELAQFTREGDIEILYEFVDDWKRIPLALIKT